MKCKTILFIFIIVLCNEFLIAQKKWSLADCMEYAIENSPQVKKKTAESDNVNADYTKAKASFFPEISAGTNVTTNFGRSIDPETNTYSNFKNFNNGYYINAGIRIFDGFKVLNNLRIAKNAENLCVSEEQQIKDMICLEVIQAYYNVIYSLQLNKLAKSQLDEAEKNLEITKRKEQQGILGYVDVAQSEAAFAEKDYNLTNTHNNYLNALSVLKQKMFFPFSDSISIEEDFDIFIDDINAKENVSSIIENAKGTLPSLLILENNIETAKLNLATSKWNVAPSISLYSGFSTGYITVFDKNYTTEPFFKQLQQRQGEYIQLSLNIPIFSGLSHMTSIKKNKNNLLIAEYEYEQKKQEIEVEIQLAVQDKERAFKSFLQAEKNVEAQRIVHKLNSKRFEQGLISILDFQTSGNNLMSAEIEYLNTFFQYNIKSHVVKYYKGIPYLNQIKTNS
jgi:outer membrane protein